MTLQEGEAVFLWVDWTKPYEKFFGLEQVSPSGR